MVLEQIIGKKSHELDAGALRDKAQGFASVIVDFGCGDGMLPYRLAKQNPDTFYIGIDAAREPLAVASAKAAKKPSRGGCENVVFLCANVLTPLPELDAIADELHWHFPWGSLMYALLRAEIPAMASMRAVGKDGAKFEFFLNLYVFENETQREDMGLPEIDEPFIEKTLIPAWRGSGFHVKRHSFVKSDELKEHPSTWAGRLVRRSGRNTLFMQGEVQHA